MPAAATLRAPAIARRNQHTRVFTVADWGTSSVDASVLLTGRTGRDVNSQVARLAEHFVAANRSAFATVGITPAASFSGNSVKLHLTASARIGAVPLASPTTGQPDFGVVVHPRFHWRGLGPMLSEMGWRVIPSPLRLPMLPQSDRQIPEWVLAAIVTARIKTMMRQLDRRFELVEENRSAPRGSVNWKRYAVRNAARARFLDVPCRFPDLRDDRRLRGAIRFTLQRVVGSLQSERRSGIHVVRLIDEARTLLQDLQDVDALAPTPREFDRWLRGPLTTPFLHDGVEAMQWTAEHRGLAGVHDLRGLPWSMSMDAFFEAWTEVVAREVARGIGGSVRTGREGLTRAALQWDPPFRGSLRSLVPDVVLDRPGLTLIIDAKYKRHWEEFQEHSWHDLADQLRDEHRDDLLQVLAYANLSQAERTVVCLAYPCSQATWNGMKSAGRHFYRGSLHAGERRLEVIFTAFPMGVPANVVAAPLAEMLRN